MHTRFLQFTPSGNFHRESLLQATARALALFFGGFSLLNLLGDFYRPGFDANLWWIDLRAFPAIPAQTFLLLSAIGLISFAIRPPRSLWRRVITGILVAALAAITFWNILEFYGVLLHGKLRILLPVPLSVFIFVALGLILWTNMRHVRFDARMSGGKNLRATFAIFLVCLVIFPVAQMIWFGKTDYRRAADVAVVFGARAYKDGRPSDALADRVKTACELYRNGLVKKLIFSGGPGDGAIPETESMRRLALNLGVAPNDIFTDNAGLNTQATVKNTTPLFAQLDAHKVIVVSHFYHLPRIKLAYQRAGLDVYTVPAKETYFLRQTPYFVAREVAAEWAYYLRPLI